MHGDAAKPYELTGPPWIEHIGYCRHSPGRALQSLRYRARMAIEVHDCTTTTSQLL
jgi:hypothetical protein